jgi:mono/diheme cytochrome c family protein
MRRVFRLALIASAAWSQEAYEQGAKVFKLTCAQGYCHGSGGTQGRAPKLIGRNYDAAAARKIIESGVAGTGMPGFKDRLNGEQLTNVLFYVVKVSGGDVSKIDLAAGAGSAGGKQAPAEAVKGKALFFDAFKGVHRCGTCHALEDIGLAVGPNLSSGGPYPVAAIRAGKDSAIRVAAVKGSPGDVFPALVAARKGDWIQVYDLTVAPPVLRTVAKAEITFSGGASWKHAEATKAYTDQELNSVAAYLAWVGER